MNVAKKNGSRVFFHCPGCGCCHAPVVEREVEGAPQWDWNSSLEKPTFSPSILVRGSVPMTDEEHERAMRGETIEPTPLVCHSFVRDGRIQFLGDCSHQLAGQTVDLPDWESS